MVLDLVSRCLVSVALRSPSNLAGLGTAVLYVQDEGGRPAESWAGLGWSARSAYEKLACTHVGFGTALSNAEAVQAMRLKATPVVRPLFAEAVTFWPSIEICA